MAEVTLEIGSRSYTLACRDGEEEHLRSMGKIVSARALDAERAMGPMSENRVLLFAALLLADTLSENARSGGSLNPDLATTQAIERLADRLEAIAETLEVINGSS